MGLLGLHADACRCKSRNCKIISEVLKVSVDVNHFRGGCRLGTCRRSLLQHRLFLLIRQLFTLPLLYLLVLLILQPPSVDGVLMTAFASLLYTCAHEVHARKDRHESVRTPWHTLVAAVRNRLYEIHSVRGKRGIAEAATPPAATAALHLRVRTVRDVLRSLTYSTPETPSTHIPCSPDCWRATAWRLCCRSLVPT
eukprot:365407-Chlamydomonas_euryale.AAC.2